MKKIKFIVDKFKERDRKQLDFIKKIIRYKPSKKDENVLFLRKFTLAILQQYNKELKFSKGKNIQNLEHELPQVPNKLRFDLKVSQAPSPINLNVNLEPLKRLAI